MASDRIVGLTSGLVGVLRWLNIAFGVAAIAAFAATWLAHGPLAAQLTAKYGNGGLAETLIWQVRALIVLGMIGVGLIDRLLRELALVLATLRAGDPFADANARRVTVIAWMLLGCQLLELALGGINWWIGHLGADNSTWFPSIGGWLAVLFAFVLARVFAAGSRMRDELATTI